MIKITLFKNRNNNICGFEAKNHGDPIVCAAVSMLLLNTVNCIEEFSNAEILCNYNDSGGFLEFEMPKVCECLETDEKADLLLKAMEFGLKSAQNEYPKNIRIEYKEVR